MYVCACCLCILYFHINLQFCMQFPSFLGEHQLGWSGDWREICGFFPNVPFEIREQGGHSLKSSIKVSTYYIPASPCTADLVNCWLDNSGYIHTCGMLRGRLQRKNSAHFI